MPLTPGQTLSHHEVLGLLGAGAMGEVYRARDTRLGREVAIKVLPEHLAGDAERLQRFEREARTLASLNHPNLATVHGIDREGETLFLVMELVPGEELAARLARGPLPPAEAFDVCRQIAEGLEVAHEAGVVHRDLKPANVRVTPEGVVKVLDFGIAKSVRDGGSEDSSLATAEGRILGTPTYMAPEQARGKPADRRVDVWAFGCVLFECLTGRRPFGGETLSDVLAAVLHDEPDLAALPAGTPASVRRLVARCLDKDPRTRLRDLGEARIVLADPGRDPAPPGSDPEPRGRTPRAAATRLALGLLLGLALGYGLSRLGGGDEAAPPAPRTTVALHHVEALVDLDTGIALSRDGRRLVYSGRTEDGVESQLYVRDLDAFRARPIPGSTFGSSPFLSPDGTRVAFDRISDLAVVDLGSGRARGFPLPPGGYAGGAWVDDRTLVVSSFTDLTLHRLDLEAGTWSPLAFDGPEEARGLLSPATLPDGEHLLVGVRTTGDARLGVLSLRDRTLELLAPTGYNPQWVDSGHVLFQEADSGALMALPFDATARRATGRPVVLFEDLAERFAYQMKLFAAARDGALVYLPSSSQVDAREVVRSDLEGNVEVLFESEGVVASPRLSPDGRALAYRRRGPECSLWVYDFERELESSVTLVGDNHGVAWLPESDGLAFCRLAEATDRWDLLLGGIDRPEEPTTVLADGLVHGFTHCVTNDGAAVLLVDGEPSGSSDILLVSVANGAVTPLIATDADEDAPSLSPDGRVLAYVSDESGDHRLYVTDFPARERRLLVSDREASEPVWDPDGGQLWFRARDHLSRVAVRIEPELWAGRPEEVLEYRGRPQSPEPSFVVEPGGASVLYARPRFGRGVSTLHLVLHATSGL